METYYPEGNLEGSNVGSYIDDSKRRDVDVRLAKLEEEMKFLPLMRSYLHESLMALNHLRNQDLAGGCSYNTTYELAREISKFLKNH